MASQKSSLPIHVKQQPSPRKVSLDLDPYAAPAEYYGKSHGPRKVAKSRTYSAVSAALSLTIDVVGLQDPGARLYYLADL